MCRVERVEVRVVSLLPSHGKVGACCSASSRRLFGV